MRWKGCSVFWGPQCNLWGRCVCLGEKGLLKGRPWNGKALHRWL